MSEATPGHSHAEPPRNYSLLAGFLSYLVPGLGQICQGRVGKGLLFMVCLLGMFYYGMDLGSWSNVYLPDTFRQDRMQLVPSAGRRIAASLADRLPFAGQFWIGVSAWPAIAQYNQIWPISDHASPWYNFQREPSEEHVNELQRNGDKGSWDLGLICTVIAGVLNILVIYDAYAGPAFPGEAEPTSTRREGEAAPA